MRTGQHHSLFSSLEGLSFFLTATQAYKVYLLEHVELVIYKALDWRLTSCFTVNNWVNTMMQLGDNVSRCSGLAPLFQNAGTDNHEFVLPKYSGREFIQVMAVSESVCCV